MIRITIHGDEGLGLNMVSIQSQTNLTQPHNIKVWRDASSKAIQIDPNNQAALYIHCALNALHDTYVTKLPTVSNPLEVRNATFNYIQQAALTGYPPALFFEGLARLEGFGCKQDQTTGKALIQVSAVARACDLAIGFVQMRIGIAHLYGKGAAQSFKLAIQNFKLAGAIAQPQLQLVAAHLHKMRLRMAPVSMLQKSNVVVLESPPQLLNKLSM